jgi:hypothetical protein
MNLRDAGGNVHLFGSPSTAVRAVLWQDEAR